MPIRLSICIPTYNRPIALRRTAERLLPQLTAECELVILDNASTSKAADVLAPVLADFPHANVRINRNTANIGGNANILRCFEFATGTYTWVLGDDDKLVENAVATVLAAVQEFPDANFLTFGSSILSPAELAKRAPFRRAASLDEFLGEIDDFGNLLFISCGVHRTEPYLKNISFAHAFNGSCAGHLVPVFLSDRSGPSVSIFHPAILVEHDVSPELSAHTWHVVNHFLPQLLFILPTESQRAVLADRMNKNYSIARFRFVRAVRWIAEAPEEKLHTVITDSVERLLFLSLWQPRRMFLPVLKLLMILLCVPLRKLLALPLRVYVRLTRTLSEEESYRSADAVGRFIDQYHQ